MESPLRTDMYLCSSKFINDVESSSKISTDIYRPIHLYFI
jgi:hypothetical protein